MVGICFVNWTLTRSTYFNTLPRSLPQFALHLPTLPSSKMGTDGGLPPQTKPLKRHCLPDSLNNKGINMGRIKMILKRKEQTKKKLRTNEQTRGYDTKDSGLRNFAYSLIRSSL